MEQRAKSYIDSPAQFKIILGENDINFFRPGYGGERRLEGTSSIKAKKILEQKFQQKIPEKQKEPDYEFFATRLKFLFPAKKYQF